MKQKKLLALAVILLLAFFVFGERLATIKGLVRPNTITVDNDQFYITDFPTIYIYSLKDFSLVKKFGKKGEGPNEFLTWIPAVLVDGDTIIVNSVGKISYFTRKGESIKEIKLTGGRNYKPLGDKYVSYAYLTDNKVEYQTVNIYDSNFNKLKEIHREKFWNQYWQGGKMDVVNAKGFIFRIFDDKIFVNREDGLIQVFDGNIGNKLREIRHKYKEIKITAADKKEYYDYYKVAPRYKEFYDVIRPRITFPSNFPPIRYFDVADGKIYVMTYERKEGKSNFIIFDLEGKLLKQVFLPLKNMSVEEPYPYTFKGGKLYQIFDNENEEWELHATNID